MALGGLIKRRKPASAAERGGLDPWMAFMGNAYQLGIVPQSLTFKQEEINPSYQGLVNAAYRENGVVFACMLVRMLLFSEARFQFRRFVNGRPGELFGTQDLAVLERPWPGGTTGDLLARAIQDVDLEGNWFALKQGDRLHRMRPDWVTIIVGSRTATDNPAWALDAEVAGYLYHPGGVAAGEKPVPLLPDNVAHFAPTPDPFTRFRGMSWLSPIVREIMADQAATTHKLKFFENGATPNLAVNLDVDKLGIKSADQFEEWVDIFNAQTVGVEQAYKTLFLACATSEVIGRDMRQIDFKVTQGAGETRIAAAAGVPPVIVGLSEGLEASTYSNYSQARRRFADGTMRPLWRNIAGSLANIIPVPSGSDLWYDDRDIPFLREDEQQEAEIQNTRAQAMRTLIDGGFDPATVVTAVTAGDLSRLVHTGYVSVQLQLPGTTNTTPNGAPLNGKTPAPAPA